MEKKKTRLHAFSLVEMLLVIAIFVIFGAFGAGGFLGFRETMFVKENVEIIKQDILLVQQKSMLLEREPGDNWLYGIGIDFSNLDINRMESAFEIEKAYVPSSSYKMFRWCSPYSDFGNSVTKSKLLGWDSSSNIGDMVNPILGVSTDTLKNDDSLIAAIDLNLALPPSGFPFKNGYLPVGEGAYTSSCTPGITSLVEITGGAVDQFVEAGNIRLIGNPQVQYVVFEAVTGKAFLYDASGAPVNYTSAAPTLFYDDSRILDIVILRKRSTKFDLISIYPTSGTIVHHVYSSEDEAPNEEEDNTITVNGKKYHRFGVFDDISSYRDYD